MEENVTTLKKDAMSFFDSHVGITLTIANKKTNNVSFFKLRD